MKSEMTHLTFPLFYGIIIPKNVKGAHLREATLTKKNKGDYHGNQFDRNEK